MRRASSAAIVAATLCLAVLVASAIVSDAVLATIACAVGLTVLLGLSRPERTQALFLQSLLVLLAGYALFGRTFAGIGVHPVYVGELVLALGLLSALANGWHLRELRTPVVYVLLGFMGWGAARTLPYLQSYGLDALRDAVLWGYGLAVFLVAPLLIRRDLIERVPVLYARLLPWVAFCTPVWIVFWEWTGFFGIPGTDMTRPKPGDSGVHLGGAAAFILTGLYARHASRSRRMRLNEWWLWPTLLVGLVAVGSVNRGGLVAMLAAITTALAMVPSKATGKLLLGGVSAALVASLWIGSGVSIRAREERTITPEQIVQNLRSIAGGSQGTALAGTREWRLNWWTDIINYTVHGPYFWTGKGFGLNIAYSDGIEPFPDSPTRSPHNGHFTVLARAGVPGFLLWAALQLGFAASMVMAYLRAAHAGRHERAATLAWVLAYWIAFHVNASFDVYLEGPQGGIWFWCVFAYGIALLSSERPLRETWGRAAGERITGLRATPALQR